MYLYFDRDGILKTKIDHGEKLRQGGDLHITVCLDYNFWLTKGWRIGERNAAIMALELVLPQGLDGTDSSVSTIPVVPDGPSDGELSTFERLYGSEVVYNLVPGNVYLMYKFHLPASLSNGFWGKVGLKLSASNNITTNDYVKIAEASVWNKKDYYLENNEVGISYSYNSQNSEIEAKMRFGTNQTHLWSSLPESPITVGETIPESKPQEGESAYYVRAKYNTEKSAIELYDVWNWNSSLEIWEMLILCGPAETVSQETYQFPLVEALVEKTVGYNKSVIDEQISVRYNDIMGELKKAFAKIAVASTKPDWAEKDQASPAYIRNKDIVDNKLSDIDSEIEALKNRHIGTQIINEDGSVEATIKKSDIIFTGDDVIINGGNADTEND